MQLVKKVTKYSVYLPQLKHSVSFHPLLVLSMPASKNSETNHNKKMFSDIELKKEKVLLHYKKNETRIAYIKHLKLLHAIQIKM